MFDGTHLDPSTKLLIVVLNYKTPKLTIDCLRSLESEIPLLPKTQVVVTDNASTNGFVEQIGAAITENHWSDWAELVPPAENGGYALSNNAAIRPLLELNLLIPYVLLLNPNTIVHSGAIQKLLDFMAKHPEVGIASSRLEDMDVTPQRSAFRFPSLCSELDGGLRLDPVTQLLQQWIIAPPVFDTSHPTDWVAEASMMIRREVIDAIGLLDEKYFMYFEEVDFCLRVNTAGWACWYVPDNRVVHSVGQSSRVTDTKCPPKRLPTYWFDSRRRCFLKKHGWRCTALIDITWFSSFTLWRWQRLIQRKPDEDPPKLWSNFLLNSVLVKGG